MYSADLVQPKIFCYIDDIYTKTINVDEDCIQALLDCGAEKVILYTIARTKHKFEHPQKCCQNTPNVIPEEIRNFFGS
ncbi:hypothetical protein [Neisseria iguanae]|uniref:hypothetical protein n=1 Tax=Neisseria iguanae TaxID=90242 RepID=UPI001B80C260|nr:hypothetical protein [Neisseria iguanae]